MSSVERAAASGLKASALARAFGQLASWASTLLVMRLLVPADYGLMAIVATLIGIGTAVAEFGLSASLIQARELERPMLARLAGLIWALHLLMFVATLAAGPLFAWLYADPRLSLLIQVAGVQFLFAGACAVPYALAARAMGFAWLARVELLATLLSCSSSLALAMAGAGVWALVGGMLAAAAARALLLIADGENVRPDFRPQGVSAHLAFSGKMAASTLLWTGVSQADVLIGAKLMPRDALGLYSVGAHLATLPMHKIMGVANQIVFSAVARLQTESERLRMRVLQGSRLMMAGAVGLLWGMGAVAPELVPLVIGSHWEPAVVPLQLVSAVVPVRMLMMLLASAVGGAGAIDVNLRNTISAALVWPPCLYVGAHWGATGLAAAWLVASPLTFALNAARIGAVLGVRVRELLELLLKPVAAGAALWLSVEALRWSVGTVGHAASRLVMLVAVGALIYIGALALLDRRLWSDLRRFASAARG
jgi:O-antigen/teichoic acid export membrane protein